MTLGMRLFPRQAAPLALLALASCVAPKAPPPAPPPPPARPAPPPAAPALGWADMPLTPGTWRWSAGEARFETGTGTPLLALHCEAGTRTIRFLARGDGRATTAPLLLSFTTSAGVFAYPASRDAAGAIVARANASDPNLDRLAFSRGRFAVAAEAAGLRFAVLPMRPEPARVIDDCRH